MYKPSFFGQYSALKQRLPCLRLATRGPKPVFVSFSHPSCADAYFLSVFLSPHVPMPVFCQFFFPLMCRCLFFVSFSFPSRADICFFVRFSWRVCSDCSFGFLLVVLTDREYLCSGDDTVLSTVPFSDFIVTVVFTVFFVSQQLNDRL